MLSGDRAALYDQRGSSGLDVSDVALEDAWNELQDAKEGACDFVIATYDGPSRVVLHHKGTGSFGAMIDYLEDNLVQYGAFRISGMRLGTRISRNVCFTWVGEDVSTMLRARVSMQRQVHSRPYSWPWPVIVGLSLLTSVVRLWITSLRGH